MQGQDTYIHIKTFEFDGMVARVFSPVLTDEERKKRMQKIHDAAANLLKEVKK